MISKMKTVSFGKVNDKKWEEVAIQSLRGLPFETLKTMTLEGIELLPLYSKELVEKTLGKKQDELVQQVRAGTKSTNWTIAQQSYAKDGRQFLAEVIHSLERGNEAIVYDGTRKVEWNGNVELKELASLVEHYPIFAFHVDKDDPFTNIFSIIPEQKRNKIKGLVSGTYELPDEYIFIRTIGADTKVIHELGADIVTELAYALACANESVNTFTTFEQFQEKFFVRFSIDVNFFMELAKLRAFRVLWQTLANAYGMNDASRVPVFVETSLRTYSKADPYVNLLRAGNETFSAVLGGADIITVHPHDVLTGPSEKSMRHARNIQHVIREETLVLAVMDPAGGSYFIDTLTNDLVEKAWQLFQTIEAQGGLTKFIESGQLQKRIDEAYEKRMQEVRSGRVSLIGTNKYADSSEKISKETYIDVPRRLAEPYEKMRLIFQDSQPNVVTIAFGLLKDHKKLVDSVANLLAVGGIQVNEELNFDSAEDAAAWMNENEFDYGIICIPDEAKDKVFDDLLAIVPSDRWLEIAGVLEDEELSRWQEKGVERFLRKGQDALDKLAYILERWQGGNKS